jgi:hypothetical protein
VVGNFGLPHFGRPELAVAEGARVLAPGGWLAVTTWDVPAEMRVFGVFLEAVAEAGAGPPDGLPPGPDVFRFSDDGEFRRLFEGQGLVDVQVRLRRRRVGARGRRCRPATPSSTPEARRAWAARPGGRLAAPTGGPSG